MATPKTQIEALTNPMLAEFLLAEIREHITHTETETNGSQLAGPRITLLRQLAHQIEQLHNLHPPNPTPEQWGHQP